MWINPEYIIINEWVYSSTQHILTAYQHIFPTVWHLSFFHLWNPPYFMGEGPEFIAWFQIFSMAETDTVVMLLLLTDPPKSHRYYKHAHWILWHKNENIVEINDYNNNVYLTCSEVMNHEKSWVINSYKFSFIQATDLIIVCARSFLLASDIRTASVTSVPIWYLPLHY